MKKSKPKKIPLFENVNIHIYNNLIIIKFIIGTMLKYYSHRILLMIKEIAKIHILAEIMPYSNSVWQLIIFPLNCQEMIHFKSKSFV